MMKYVTCSMIVVAGACLMIGLSRNPANKVATLTILCGPSLSGPMEEAKKEFPLSGEGAAGIGIEITYRGSAELLPLYEVSGFGDMLIAADVDYHRPLVEKKLCDAPMILGQQYPCLIFTSVSQPAALSILSNDEMADQVSTSLPKTEHAAIGRKVAAIIGTADYQRLADKAKVTRETVSQVAADVSNEIVDVGIAWSTTSKQFANLQQAVPEGWEQRGSEVGASIFTDSKNRSAAERFRTFLTSPTGRAIFERHGFDVTKIKESADRRITQLEVAR